MTNQKRKFHKGSLKMIVSNFIKSKKSVTLEELKSEYPKMNRNTLRKILSDLVKSKLLTRNIVWDYNE